MSRIDMVKLVAENQIELLGLVIQTIQDNRRVPQIDGARRIQTVAVKQVDRAFLRVTRIRA